MLSRLDVKGVRLACGTRIIADKRGNKFARFYLLGSEFIAERITPRLIRRIFPQPFEHRVFNSLKRIFTV